MAAALSHAINLYSPDGVQTVKLSVGSETATFNADLPLVFGTRVDIGSHEDVAALLTSMQQTIATNAVTAAEAAATVQSNIDSYISTNNAAVATTQAALTSETAQREAAVTASTTLCTGLVTTEQNARIAAVTTLTDTLSAETVNRAAAVSAEASARAAALTSLSSELSVERSRIGGILAGSTVDLNTFAELVAAFEAADNSLFATLQTIQSNLTTLTARFNALTETS